MLRFILLNNMYTLYSPIILDQNKRRWTSYSPW